MLGIRPTLCSIACVLSWAGPGCGDDTGTDGAGRTSAGAGAGASAQAGASGALSAMPRDSLPEPFDTSMPAPTGPVCGLSVAASCDGNEDCPSGQVCCGDIEMMSFRYTRIACQDSCPRDQMHYRLCHPGETCTEPSDVCRHSQILPYDFLAVCAPPAMNVTTQPTGSIGDGVACGSTTCGAGESCCLRSLLDRAAMMRQVLEPYCMPPDGVCDCATATDGGVGDEDAGTGTVTDADAGP